MGLESVTHISDLNSANPTSTDPKSEGDNHIRNIKTALLTDFPAISGVVTASHTELSYVDGVTSAIQTQLDAKAPLASPALTGTPTAPTASAGTSTTQIATTAFVAATAFSSALPGISSSTKNRLLSNNGSTADWYEILDYEARTSNTILAAADVGKFINITSGTFTQTFTAAATLGAGWYIYIKNVGTGDVTLDPNSSETIDSLTTFLMYPGEARLIVCNGTNFDSYVLNSFRRLYSASTTFTRPPGYSGFFCQVWGAGGSGGKGSAGTASGGGGGGGYNESLISHSAMGASQTITIGAGGASQTTGSTAGNAGGNSSIGSIITGYGGAGGGVTSIGNGGGGGGSLGAGSGKDGGYPRIAVDNGIGAGSSGTATQSGDNAFGGGGAGNASSAALAVGANSHYGGGGGGGGRSAGGVGGNSYYGGAGGGGASSTGGSPISGGTSVRAGNGGAGGYDSTNGVAGTTPSGGGGGAEEGNSGAGGDGQIIIWGIV